MYSIFCNVMIVMYNMYITIITLQNIKYIDYRYAQYLSKKYKAVSASSYYYNKEIKFI